MLVRTSLCLAAVLAWGTLGCVADAAQGVSAAADAVLASSSQLTIVSSSVPARVQPSGALAVSITVRNDGATTWRTGTTRLVFNADGLWQSATLSLGATTRPGQSGVFAGVMTAPVLGGVYALSWQLLDGATIVGTVQAGTEVTCSDGVFCNGTERWVNGTCQSGPAPCDDHASCTTDVCNEAEDTCTFTANPGCATCDAPNCRPNCHGNVCGDDGCGGSCGSCGLGQTCLDGVCAVVTTPGTCANPIALIGPGETLIGDHTILGDSTTGINGTVPTCNTASTARDLVYTFTLTEPLGIDARMSGYDSVLSLRSVACADNDPAMHTQPNWCSDDASPPGEYGSRIATMLQPGTYFLIADGYNGQQVGPFTLSVRFVRDCVPQCDGKYCGDDGCGGSCGACPSGQLCSPSTSRCAAAQCTPDCRGRQCGDDGCGGSCGSCRKSELCVGSNISGPSGGACRAFFTCDHQRPVCRTACSRQEFCGSDCACHRLRDGLPDLVVDRALLQRDIVITSGNFGGQSCAIVEGCVAGPGTRRLLRFAVAAVNQGQGDLQAPDAADHPELFEFSPCHGHYHYSGFAAYALLDPTGRVVLRGHKQAYCMEDSFQARVGPAVSCSASHTCESQGIQHGWADVYGNDLDCQWIDITDLPAGNYQISVTLNPTRTFEEMSFDNNTTVVPVVIP